MVNAQEWLDKNYPLEEKKNVTILNIREKNLEGELKLEGFENLDEFVCAYNFLTKLDLSNCQQLTVLTCFCNPLTEIEFLTNLAHPQKLVYLDMGDCNFSTHDLSFLEKFTNLETLYLWNLLEERIKKGLCNRFYGSMKYLENITNLKGLGITNTDIDSGLEHLSQSLEEIYCDDYGRKPGCSKIKEQLEIYASHKGIFREDALRRKQIPYKYQVWKKSYLVIKNLKEENAKLSSLEGEVERLINLIKEQKEKIINAYSHFFQEKKLLKELISAYLKYSKARSQKLPAFQLRKKYNTLYEELAEKVGEELMEKVEAMLADCEQLIHYEFDLQREINKDPKLIANSLPANYLYWKC